MAALIAPDGWTPRDQRLADGFEQQIAPLQHQMTGAHRDVMVVGFVQALRTLMAERVAADPACAIPYVELLAWIATQLEDVAMAVAAAATEVRH